MPRPFDPRKHCGAKKTGGVSGEGRGEPCTQWKGWGTNHAGAGHCRSHGGNSPNGKAFARREAANNALRTLRIETAIDPTEALLEALRVACWREAGLRQMLTRRTALFGPDHLGDARPDVVAVMHAEALDQRAKIAKMAVDANIDERVVRLYERQADEIHRILVAGLDAAGLEGESRSRAEDAIARELEAVVAVMPAGGERN